MYTYIMENKYENKNLTLKKAKKLLKDNKKLWGFDGIIINSETGEIVETSYEED